MLKRFSVLIAAAVITLSTVTAQTGRGEMTPEQLYLQETIELMIIRETARSQSREQKLIALEYIGEALDRGSTNDELRQTLQYLVEEGTRSVTRENNRVVNNFPDVRRRSARLLGQVGTEEATNSLLGILEFESEPMVITEAIKSLGDIGINNNDRTIIGIIQVARRNDSLNRDNQIALATIDAFEKIARKDGALTNPEAIQLLMRISEGTYITPIKERARQLLADLRTMGR